ncbi:MAG: hypothetical protein Q8Q73_06160, partial [Stagnimonas sp.]|nr:hypothetical protein [Stagnimonas sp.]
MQFQRVIRQLSGILLGGGERERGHRRARKLPLAAALAASFSVAMVATVVVQHRQPFGKALGGTACPEGYVAR